jgi:hypothetical protein
LVNQKEQQENVCKLGFKEKIDVEPEQYIKAKTKSHDTKLNVL